MKAGGVSSSLVALSSLPEERRTLPKKNLRARFSFVRVSPCRSRTERHKMSGPVRGRNGKGVEREVPRPVANGAAGREGREQRAARRAASPQLGAV